MKILRDFLSQKVDRFNLLLWGNLIGVVGVIFLGLTLGLIYISVNSNAEFNAGDRVVTGLLLLASSLLSYCFIATACRAVSEADDREDEY